MECELYVFIILWCAYYYEKACGLVVGDMCWCATRGLNPADLNKGAFNRLVLYFLFFSPTVVTTKKKKMTKMVVLNMDALNRLVLVFLFSPTVVTTKKKQMNNILFVPFLFFSRCK